MITGKTDRSKQIVVSLSAPQKRLVDRKAKEEEIKPATYVKSCLLKYLKQQGEQV